MDAIGVEVGDRETGGSALPISGKDIFAAITGAASKLGEEWQSFESAVRDRSASLPPMPRTFFEALFEDVTGKTKSIALSTKFGPHYESGMRRAEAFAIKLGANPREVHAVSKRMLEAKDPDEFRRTPRM